MKNLHIWGSIFQLYSFLDPNFNIKMIKALLPELASQEPKLAPDNDE